MEQLISEDSINMIEALLYEQAHRARQMGFVNDMNVALDAINEFRELINRPTKVSKE
jgi:hypothetical protein